VTLPAGESRRRRPDRGGLVIAAGLAGLALVIFRDASHLRPASGYAGIGPAAFPTVVATGLVTLAAATALSAWRAGFPPRASDRLEPIAWIVGGLVAQLLLLKLAGFSIATGLLFAATARGFGRGPLWMTIPIGIALALAIFVIFSLGLKLSLPAGPLEHLFV
jgi:putative tricarboxylic transport membrane protein